MLAPVPVLILARLAVVLRAQGRKLGAVLPRSVQVSRNAGIRARPAHALHDRPRQFDEQDGFMASPVRPLTLVLRLPQDQDDQTIDSPLPKRGRWS